MIAQRAGTARASFTVRLWAAALLLCFSLTGFSEGSDDSGTVVKAPPPPTVSDPSPPKPVDRQKSSAAAKAMALGGAAMSNVMCMMMMSQAMEEKDSTNKALMMMAAQQACQQGAELAKSAMENDKGMKLASQDDIPKQSTFKATGMEIPQAKSKEENLIKGIPRITNDDEAPKSDGSIPQLKSPDLTVFEKTAAEPTKAAPVEDLAYKAEQIPAKSFTAKEGVTELQPIKGAQVSFDDKAKAGQAPLGPQLSSLGGALAASGQGNTASSTTSSKSSDAKEEAVVSSGRGKARNVQAEEGSGSSGGGGGGDSTGGGSDNSAFEAMLSQILGGPPEAGSVGGASAEITALPGQPDPSKPAPNVFEYATFRLQKLAFEQGRIRSRPFKGTKSLPPTTQPVKKTKVAKANP